MSRSLEIFAGRRAVVALALTALVLGSGAPCALAQRQVQLIGFTNTVWRYEASGADQGVAWKSPTFDDTSWPSGRGLFGYETNPEFYPYPFNTIFDPFDPNILTYYFRTHFEMAASDFVFPLTLICSNLIDDGCAVYLNSNVVETIRVPTGLSFQMPATGVPGTEGVIEGPVNILTNWLRVGDNVMAVEVHQVGIVSSDIAFGLSLTAIVPTSLSITSQPQSQITTVGIPVVLSVGVAGGPALFQWQRDNGSGGFTNVPGTGARSSSYTYTPRVAGTASYQVVAYNGVNSVTSSPAAVVTALADNQGPRMLSAIVLEEATRTNRILISWSESLLTSTILFQSVSNFQVILLPSNTPVAISNVLYNPGTFPSPEIRPSVTLTMSTTNWHIGSNYYVSVSHVKDAIGNVIAPDSRIAVAWPRTTNVMQFGHVWSFYGPLGPDIFDQPWYATNYVEGPGWERAPGPFCSGDVTTSCFGELLLCDSVAFERQPALFRTTFVGPTNPSVASQLKLAFIVDDAVVFYLNGTELLRYNLPPGPLTPQTKAEFEWPLPACGTNTITVANVFPGTNWLAAAVFRALDAGGPHAAFYLVEMDHRGFHPGTLPEVPVPRLNIAAEGTNQFRLWWDGPGYTLESTTNLALNGSGAVGTWLEVTNMSNPFIDMLTGERRFFRLRQ